MTFAEIKAQLMSLINRTDMSDAVAANFIQMAQDRLERWPQVEPLRYAPRPSFMEKLIKFTVAEDVDKPGAFTVPNDFLQVISIYSGSTELERVGVPQFLRYNASATGDPAVFMQARHAIHLRPVPAITTDMYMLYYSTASALVEGTDENEWTTSCADVLLYGAAVYAADHFEDDRFNRFESRFTQGLMELQDQTINEALSGSMAISPVTSYPTEDY